MPHLQTEVVRRGNVHKGRIMALKHLTRARIDATCDGIFIPARKGEGWHRQQHALVVHCRGVDCRRQDQHPVPPFLQIGNQPVERPRDPVNHVTIRPARDHNARTFALVIQLIRRVAPMQNLWAHSALQGNKQHAPAGECLASDISTHFPPCRDNTRRPTRPTRLERLGAHT